MPPITDHTLAGILLGLVFPGLAGWCGYLTRDANKMKDDLHNQAIVTAKMCQKLDDLKALVQEIRDDQRNRT